METWLPLAFSVLFEILKSSIKNPTSKKKWRTAFLKLRDAINLAYQDDEAFGFAEEFEKLREASAGVPLSIAGANEQRID